MLGAVQDVTEQRRAEEARRMVEDRFQRVVERSPLSTQLFWPDGRPRQVNAAFTKLFGITIHQLHDYNILRDPELVKLGVMPLMERAFAGEAVEIEPIPYRPYFGEHVGQTRWAGAHVYPVKDDDGRVEEVVLVHIDVTERKRAEAERDELWAAERAARAEAERQGRLKDEFLATLGHELRTPLNAILGWAQILRGGVRRPLSADDVAQGLEAIERNARAQARIIGDLLEMSRIVAGKIRLDVQQVQLAAVVEAAVQTVWHAAAAKGVRLDVALDPAAGPVSGDPARLQQVFWNLLSNGVKHGRRGGVVRVVIGRAGSDARVSVADDGEGIDPAFLPFVFDRFRQADGSTTRRHGGLGLGLSIVKQIVELHGGTVRADSAGEGLGATFTVSLPLAPVRVGPAAPESSPAAADVSPSNDAPEARRDARVSLAGVRVLVVDDEADAREVIRRVLADHDAEVATAASAAEAIDAVRRGPPDVLLSDIGMPGEDGYALVRRLRALPAAEGGDVPAAALTAYARTEDRVRALLAGFQLHLPKPVEPAELVATVASLARAGATR